jgi:hypothetical protein
MGGHSGAGPYAQTLPEFGGPGRRSLDTRRADAIHLPNLMKRIKSFTATEYRRRVAGDAWQSMPGKLWQRNYHDRIIRNERELTAIREYIANNPMQWHLDRLNPEVFPG